MSDWDEIQRLAADLQRAQLTSSAQKLSERNCIEIVNKLVQTGILDIIYTSDGKEYITPKQLQREISDEVYMSGGRIGIPELSNILTIDYSQIEAQASGLVKSDSRLFMILGQLISADYLDRIAEDINDRLQLDGTIAIATLTKELNLPADFVFEQVSLRLGSIIEGFKDESDPKVIITSGFLSRNRARIRGVLTAITVPTSVSSIVTKFNFDGRLFLNLADQLIREGALKGTISGGKQLSKATYIPSSYAAAQNDWVDNFFTQNGYLEYDAVSRIGITDPETYIKRKFNNLTFLSTCCVGQQITDQIEASVEEALATGSFVEVQPLLPSILSQEDCNILLQKIITDHSSKKRVSSANGIILAETVVTCQGFLDRLIEPFKEKITEKATRVVNNGEYGKAIKDSVGGQDDKFDFSMTDQVDKKEERRKKAAGGSKGGGTQGREGKTKSTKKKAGGNKRGGRRDSFESDEEEFTSNKKSNAKTEKPVNEALLFMSVSDVEKSLKDISILQEACEDLFVAIALQIQPTLSKLYNESVSELYRSSLTASLQKKKKSHVEFQEKTIALIETIRLFEKGISSFDDNNDKTAFEKCLIKSLCSELVNGIFHQLASDHDINVDYSKELNSDQRVKLLGQIPKDISNHLVVIHKALNSNKVEEFIHSLEEHLGEACDVMMRKVDKKKDRQTQFHHRQTLMEQVESCQEPATILLIVSLVVFQLQTGNMLHASGKLVPIIVKYIYPGLEKPEQEVLDTYQNLIMKHFSASGGDRDDIQLQLENLSPAVKDVVLKKSKQ